MTECVKNGIRGGKEMTKNTEGDSVRRYSEIYLDDNIYFDL